MKRTFNRRSEVDKADAKCLRRLRCARLYASLKYEVSLHIPLVARSFLISSLLSFVRTDRAIDVIPIQGSVQHMSYPRINCEIQQAKCTWKRSLRTSLTPYMLRKLHDLHDYSGFTSLQYIRCLHLSVYLKKLSIAQAMPNLKIG